MKRALCILSLAAISLGLSAAISPAVFPPAHPTPAALPQGAPLKTLQGTVRAEGDKITLVADEDGKSWEVMNPDTLKPHVGHHVEVSAHVYAEKNSIHVMSVKMAKKGG